MIFTWKIWLEHKTLMFFDALFRFIYILKVEEIFSWNDLYMSKKEWNCSFHFHPFAFIKKFKKKKKLSEGLFLTFRNVHWHFLI